MTLQLLVYNFTKSLQPNIYTNRFRREDVRTFKLKSSTFVFWTNKRFFPNTPMLPEEKKSFLNRNNQRRQHWSKLFRKLKRWQCQLSTAFLFPKIKLYPLKTPKLKNTKKKSIISLYYTTELHLKGTPYFKNH